MWGKSGASSAPQCDCRLLVVLRLFAGGKAKSYPLFSGEIHAGKHAAQGKWGTILKESTPVFPAFPSQKSLGFWGDGSALLPCHASPAHDARLPSDSGHKQAGYAVLGLYPSLRSIRAVRNGSALRCCHASPAHDARLPSDSGHKQAGYAVLGLYPSLRSIRAVRNGSALLG